MQRFEFKLERVLRFKQLREKAAEIRQKKSAAALKGVLDDITTLQDHLGQTAQTVEQKLAEGAALSLSSWLACYAQAIRIGKAIEDAEKKADQAKQVLLEANAQRKQAAIEVEGVLTLRKRQWEIYQRMKNRQEQERSDEFALRRWQGRTAQNKETGGECRIPNDQ
jgi:flagellar export protein FliJ